MYRYARNIHGVAALCRAIMWFPYYMAGEEYTIDELARAAGTTVRSLRVYHERGVLPPPQVKGRTGFYGREHLNRVQTIGRLLDRGIKLNGIKELLEAWGRGDDLGDILGVYLGPEADPDRSAEDGAPGDDAIPAIELEQRYRDVPNGLARVVAAGLYAPIDAANYRVADRQLLRICEQLGAAGLPDDEALGEAERLRADSDRIARRFVDLFHRTAWREYRESEGDTTDLAQLTARLEQAKVVPGRASAELIHRFVSDYFAADSEIEDLFSRG